MGQVLQIAVALTEINCGECGGSYAINQRYHDKKRESGGFWNCPYCKVSWGFPKDGSENEKLRRELDEERKRKAAALARENEERAARVRAETAAKRLKRRVNGGACPCCNRTFVALGRHMAAKHPEFVKDAK